MILEKLTLVNTKRQSFYLGIETDVRVAKVTGLGVELSGRFIEDEKGSRVVTATNSLKSASMELHFMDGYNTYSNFVNFISESPLMVENTTGSNTYQRIIFVEGLGKGQLRGSRLIETFAIKPLSPWYRKKNYFDASTQATVQASGFMLPVVFPFTFGTLASDKKSAFNIRNNSTYLVNQRTRMSPVKVKITAKNADVVNPYWEVFANSERVSSDGYDITIPIGWTLEVSSLFQERTALLIDPDGKKSSVYQQQHMERGGFVHVPIGESTIVFHVQGEQVSCDVYEEVDLF